MPEEIISARISALNPAYQAFVQSDFIGEVAVTFAEVYSFDARKVDILENAITLYLLLFLSREDATLFISRNCDLPLPEAEMLFTGIVSTLPEGLEEMISTQFSQLQTEDVKSTVLASEIAETEKAFENLQGIRTMAKDMREVQTESVSTHQSSQSDIIQPATPPLPTNGPRWETDKQI